MKGGTNWTGYTGLELAILAAVTTGIFIVGLIGWVDNILKLTSIISEPVSGWLILRVIGICAPPLGAILGYL